MMTLVGAGHHCGHHQVTYALPPPPAAHFHEWSSPAAGATWGKHEENNNHGTTAGHGNDASIDHIITAQLPMAESQSGSSQPPTSTSPLLAASGRRSSYFRLAARHYSSSTEQQQEAVLAMRGEELLHVTGRAYLCFLRDGSAFHGHVLGDKATGCEPDGDVYRLLGTRVDGGGPTSGDARHGEYEVHVLDYDDMDNLSPVHISGVVRSGACDVQLCLQTPPPPTTTTTSSSSSPLPPYQHDAFCFHTKELHIGSKADILIQKYFSSKFTDIHCFVCAGPIHIKCHRRSQRLAREPETGVW